MSRSVVGTLRTVSIVLPTTESAYVEGGIPPTVMVASSTTENLVYLADVQILVNIIKFETVIQSLKRRIPTVYC